MRQFYFEKLYSVCRISQEPLRVVLPIVSHCFFGRVLFLFYNFGELHIIGKVFIIFNLRY